MKNIILFDNETREQLLPFTFIRPVCELRAGILTNRERWELALGGKASYITQDYLSDKYDITISEQNYLVNGAIIPDENLISIIKQIRNGEALLFDGELVAAVLNREQFDRLMDDDIDELTSYEISSTGVTKLNRLWDLVYLNDRILRQDYDMIAATLPSVSLDSDNRLMGEDILVEPGAIVSGATLNARTGPIHIGAGAQVMEGAVIRGPFSLGAGSIVKMGARIYGATTVGPGCVVAGEIKNSLFMGNSNKAHDGYLGDSVIGEWCNIGADTNVSNLKNTFGDIRIWDYQSGTYEPSGKQKLGLFLGDFSVCGINTMFNTGTVAGVAGNIFGSSFQPKYIPSFSWGGGEQFSTYHPEKAFQVIERMMALKGRSFLTEDRVLLMKVFEDTAAFRAWDSPAPLGQRFFRGTDKS
ncbi:MAG: hypothetical protein RLY31_1526 [Bacteroidota bacterium]|jgi:UDP-N-acetylglucosamine diphosphorylase/glucosamine-1-phosphate N-acetyltransferase